MASGPQLPHKVLAMDCRYPYLAIATSNKDVHVYNLSGGVRMHKASVVWCCEKLPLPPLPRSSDRMEESLTHT